MIALFSWCSLLPPSLVWYFHVRTLLMRIEWIIELRINNTSFAKSWGKEIFQRDLIWIRSHLVSNALPKNNDQKLLGICLRNFNWWNNFSKISPSYYQIYYLRGDNLILFLALVITLFYSELTKWSSLNSKKAKFVLIISVSSSTRVKIWK